MSRVPPMPARPTERATVLLAVVHSAAVAA